jgi:hypothetical protein
VRLTLLVASVVLARLAAAVEPDLAVFDAEGADPFGDWSREVADTAQGWDPQRIVDSPVRAGQKAIRIEIQYRQPSVNCCARSEVTRGTTDYTTDWWYGFSIYLPAEFTTDSVAEIIAQWHEYPDFALGEDWRSPPLALLTEDGKVVLARMWAAAAVNTNATVDGTEYVDLGVYETDVWTDWVVHLQWGWAQDGIVEVWRNGTKVVERLNVPVSYNDQAGPYFKFGLYKWDWPAGGDGSASTPTRFAFYDEVRQARGSAGYGYDDVAPRSSADGGIPADDGGAPGDDGGVPGPADGGAPAGDGGTAVDSGAPANDAGGPSPTDAGARPDGGEADGAAGPADGGGSGGAAALRGGCGCAAGTGAGSGLLAALALLLGRRRRG